MGARTGVALLAALTLAATGCGGSSSEGGPGEAGNTGAPVKGQKGGKVTFLAAADVDYLDPGQTYYTFGYAGARPRRGRPTDLQGQQDDHGQAALRCEVLTAGRPRGDLQGRQVRIRA